MAPAPKGDAAKAAEEKAAAEAKAAEEKAAAEARAAEAKAAEEKAAAAQHNQVRVFIAIETGACDLDGEQVFVHKNVTRVREGHPLLAAQRGWFKEADSGVHYDVEDASAAPGHKRGQL